MKVLFDSTTEATTEVFSAVFKPDAGAVSSSFLLYSSAVNLTVDIEVDMGGSIGWVDYIVDEAVTAGTAQAIVVDVDLPQRVAITPASGTATAVKVLASSNGVK